MKGKTEHQFIGVDLASGEDESVRCIAFKRDGKIEIKFVCENHEGDSSHNPTDPH